MKNNTKTDMQLKTGTNEMKLQQLISWSIPICVLVSLAFTYSRSDGVLGAWDTGPCGYG